MKKYIIKSILLAGVLLMATDCQKSFLEVPPQDQITVDNFFDNEEQINATTAGLYGFPWFDFNDKASFCIGDVMGGNMHTWDGAMRAYLQLAVRSDDPRVNESWTSLYRVVGYAGSVINILPKKADAAIPREIVDRGVGEARFIRALAYFYLVRGWGAVPIVEDSEKLLTGDFKINRHRVEDVYTFILRDLEFAEQHCPAQWGGANEGRVTTYTAKALMAKVYLYLQQYDKARQKAEEVVSSGKYALLPNYGDVFKTANDNSVESIFALQWVVCPDCWGQQNTYQAYFAPFGEGITETGDGWGSVTPSVDLIKAYEPNDKRVHATMMSPGAFYPELTSKTNPAGYTYPELSTKVVSSTHRSMRKYIVGSAQSPDGPVFFMRTGINTNVLRYSELLLIHAEAVMAGAGTTSDAAALDSYNKVRLRAGLPTKTVITFDDIFRERRVELAFEHDYWFDICRQGPTKAKEIIAAQQRGFFWGMNEETEIVDEKYVADDTDLLLPIPQSETDQNPKLLEPPVAYPF
jgi:starch-binding outer membrane protein, SusD/RagB family